MPSPRAVFVCSRLPYPPVSGGVKRTLRLLEAADRAGLAVHVHTSERPEQSALAVLESRGWQVYVASERLASVGRRLDQHRRRLPAPRSKLLAAEVRVNSVHSAFVQAEGIMSASYLLDPLGAPRIFSTQNVDSDVARGVVRATPTFGRRGLRARYHWQRVARTERRAATAADATLCVSEEDAARFERYSPRVIVAPNGVNDPCFWVPAELPRNSDVLFFGQLSYEPNAQGLERFLRDGWPVVRARNAQARLLIAGEGSAQRIDSSPQDRVEVLGLVPDIAAQLARARAVVVPIWDGGGTRLKVLEALAAARPLAATTLGVKGIGFEHMRHGAVADDPSALAEWVVRLCGDEALSIELARAGRELARRYRWELALASAEALFAEFAQRARGRA